MTDFLLCCASCNKAIDEEECSGDCWNCATTYCENCRYVMMHNCDSCNNNQDYADFCTDCAKTEFYFDDAGKRSEYCRHCTDRKLVAQDSPKQEKVPETPKPLPFIYYDPNVIITNFVAYIR